MSSFGDRKRNVHQNFQLIKETSSLKSIYKIQTEITLGLKYTIKMKKLKNISDCFMNMLEEVFIHIHHDTLPDDGLPFRKSGHVSIANSIQE